MKKEFVVEREGRSFVLYAGLLDEAHGQGLKSIQTTLIQIPHDENGNVAICQAIVETEKGRFSGIGDASPANVTRIMTQHIIRMAETRAKARALRDAVNVGVAAIEELGDIDGDTLDAAPPAGERPKPATAGGQRNGQGAAAGALGVCPVHGVPWRESKRGGSPWHPADGGKYCNQWDLNKG